jgi:hypothetical protein
MMWGDLREIWQIRQGAACSCFGHDDMCPCQNVDLSDPASARAATEAPSFTDADRDRAAEAIIDAGWKTIGSKSARRKVVDIVIASLFPIRHGTAVRGERVGGGTSPSVVGAQSGEASA